MKSFSKQAKKVKFTTGLLSIGKVAKMSGVGIETIRFYEAKGLIPKPLRRGSSYRYYTEEYVSLIQDIRTARDLGFSLPEIGRLLKLFRKKKRLDAKTRKKVKDKMVEIEFRIKELQKLRRSLESLVG